MEIKKENEFKSNHFYITKNIHEIPLKQLFRLQCARIICENHRINRLHSYTKKINKQIVWHSGVNKMFQNLRRRQNNEKRVHQGHNKVWNVAKMPYNSDSLRFEDTILVQNHEIMLKSAVFAPMWNKCYDRDN